MTGSPFADMMLSGAFIFSADKDHKLLYTNEQLVRFFECEDTADLMKYVGGSFDGMIHDPEPEMINKEMESQLGGSSSGSGYVFFNIITKNGDVLRVVVHWTRTCDDDMGDVFYSVIYLHNLDLFHLRMPLFVLQRHLRISKHSLYHPLGLQWQKQPSGQEPACTDSEQEQDFQAVFRPVLLLSPAPSHPGLTCKPAFQVAH